MEPTTSDGEGRRTTTYRITAAGRAALADWMAERRVGFPVLKHTGAAAAADRARRASRSGSARCSRSTSLSSRSRGDDLREVRDSLRGGRRPGEAFHYPSVVADWGLDYFAAEARHTRKALDRLSVTTDSEEP